MMATLTIEEGFDGAFMNGDDLEIEVRGIPNGATVGISATAYPLTGERREILRLRLRRQWPPLTPWLWWTDHRSLEKPERGEPSH